MLLTGALIVGVAGPVDAGTGSPGPARVTHAAHSALAETGSTPALQLAVLAGAIFLIGAGMLLFARRHQDG